MVASLDKMCMAVEACPKHRMGSLSRGLSVDEVLLCTPLTCAADHFISW